MFGIGGGVGFLLGLVAVWWVEPTTEGGTLLLVAIFVIASAVVGGIATSFFGPIFPMAHFLARISLAFSDSCHSPQALTCLQTASP
ncbi:MAG: hypothetical protein WAN46_22590 [Gammaproteobacteria bacterium]